MGAAASLVMWPICGEQTFVPLIHWGTLLNLTDWPSGFWGEDWRRMNDGACLYYKLTYPSKDSSELQKTEANRLQSSPEWTAVKANILNYSAMFQLHPPNNFVGVFVKNK